MGPIHFSQLFQEMTCMFDLHHPNLLKMVDFYHTPGAIFLQLEICLNGDLHETFLLLNDNGKKLLDEPTIITIMT